MAGDWHLAVRGGCRAWRSAIAHAEFRDHGPLTLIQVSALEVLADDVTDRIVAGVGN